MPLYFFHLRSKAGLAQDPEGFELPDMGAARTEAIEGAREVIADRVRFGDPVDFADSFEITDIEGRVLEAVLFSDAIK